MSEVTDKLDNMVFPIGGQRYADLLAVEAELFALRSAGVDNWEGYDSVDWESLETKKIQREKILSEYPEHSVESVDTK